MLLRYFSPLIIFLIAFGCNNSENKTTHERLHRIGVLGLFKPSTAEITFSQNILVQGDNSEPIAVTKNMGIKIESKNSALNIKIRNKIYTFHKIIFLTQNHNPFYDNFSITVPNEITRNYNGGLEINNHINEMKLFVLQKTEDYVLGVLSSESSDNENEYLKALSIIIRTYILYNQSRHFTDGFDFCDNTHCMVFYGEQNKNNLFRAAVKATKGEALNYNKNLIDVFFSGSCGGKTKTPNSIWKDYKLVYPYSSIECPYCRSARHKAWSWAISISEFLKLFPDAKSICAITESTMTDSIEAINIITDKTTISLSKDEFRLHIGRIFGWNKIYSDNYSFTRRHDSVFFSGQGFGHCIGFCQSGAEEMSRLGKTYKEILKYYYPKASL